MALVLIVACWLLLVSVVIGACVVARHGDRQLQRDTPTRAPRPAGLTARGARGRLELQLPADRYSTGLARPAGTSRAGTSRVMQ
jgi:hypothetical protein